ncbi:MAG TPA: hypothetical protein VL096_15465, partial [Pirellulaceae bacterium]|nr:hypothetical protein [Pirellulaceae bacterium]
MGSGQPVSAGSSAATELASARDLLYRRQMPAWLLSFGVHLAFFVVLAVAVPHLPQGAAEETTHTGGIVLVSRAAGPPQYLSEEDAGGSLTSTDTSALANPSGSALATAATSDANQKIESELAGLLPQGSESLAGSASVGLGADQAQEMTQGTLGPKLGMGHNYTETGVFGVKGRGTKFVYVFDRSGSMSGFGGRPLAAAKRELLASINDLDTVHQFQVIFYNER